jgi:hypothetical protein
MSQQDETPDKLIGSIPYGSVRPANRTRAQDSIPYGSLKPNTVTTLMPDTGEKLTIPYGSLRATAPAPVAQTPQAQQSANQAPPMPPSSPSEQEK